MQSTDALGVLFCMVGLVAAVAAWRVFLGRAKLPVPNFPSRKNERRRGILGVLWDVVFILLAGDYPGRRSDGPVGWVSAFVALTLISAIFLIGGVYVGLQ